MRILASHLGQRRASKPKVRSSKTLQSTREDIAKSSPPRIRFQCFTVMTMGSPEATACASEELGARDEDASAGDAGVSLRVVVGGEGAEDAEGGEGDGDTAVFAAVPASLSLHGLDFFGLAMPSGGFGVTSARHFELTAKTP